ncbi:hypothetical protein ILUMI_14800, partial [Ignelater luminosus]
MHQFPKRKTDKGSFTEKTMKEAVAKFLEGGTMNFADGSKIFNLEETGTSTVPNTQKVVAKKREQNSEY